MDLKYLRKTRGGIGYRREIPRDLRTALGVAVFTQPLGKTAEDAARNWSKVNTAYEALVKDARRALPLSSSAATVTPLALYNETLGYLRGLRLNPWDVGVEETDPASIDLATGREAAAEAIIGAYPVGHDGSIQLSPMDERRVRALHNGIGSAPSPKLSEAVALYLTEQPAQAKRKNRQRIDRAVRQLEAEAGRDPLVSGITRQDARAMRDRLVENDKAPATVKRAVGSLKAVLNVAKREYQLSNWDNPFDKLSIPKDGATRDKRKALPQDVIASVLEDLRARPRKQDFQRIWRLLAGTGCRMGEIAWCAVGDMNLSDDYPHINLVEREESGQILGEAEGGVKSEAGRRLVPLVGDALSAAREAVEASRGNQYLFPDYARDGGGDALSSSLMRYVRARTKDKRHVAHSLRHNVTDRLITALTPEEVRNDILGHTQAGVGSRTYGSRTSRLAVGSAAMKKAFGEAGGDGL